MIQINKFILIICFLVLLLIFIICKNDILYFFNNTNKLLGGNTDNLETNTLAPTNAPTNAPTGVPTQNINSEVASLENTLRSEENKIDKIRNELESLRRNRELELDNLVDDNSDSNYIKLNRDILDNNNDDAIRTIVENDEINNSDTIDDESDNSDTIDDESDNSDTIDDESDGDDELVKMQKTKAWENMCEKDYQSKKKKSKYMDLKLDLNNSLDLQPFNNDDYTEFGKFNC